jgi:hypothetical protein
MPKEIFAKEKDCNPLKIIAYLKLFALEEKDVRLSLQQKGV